MNPETDLEKRWHLLCQLNRQVSRLRRDDHRARRLALDEERRAHELALEAKAEREKVEAAASKKAYDIAIYGPRHEMMEEFYGGGDYGRRLADHLFRLRFDLPLGDNPPVPPNTPLIPSDSGPFKVDKARAQMARVQAMATTQKSGKTPNSR